MVASAESPLFHTRSECSLINNPFGIVLNNSISSFQWQQVGGETEHLALWTSEEESVEMMERLNENASDVAILRVGGGKITDTLMQT